MKLFDEFEKVVAVVRFAEEVADVEGVVGSAVVPMKAGRKDDNLAGKVVLAEMTHEAQTVEARHLVVGDDEVESVWLGGEQVGRVLAVVCEDDGKVGGGEKKLEGVANLLVVLGAKDAQRP